MSSPGSDGVSQESDAIQQVAQDLLALTVKLTVPTGLLAGEAYRASPAVGDLLTGSATLVPLLADAGENAAGWHNKTAEDLRNAFEFLVEAASAFPQADSERAAQFNAILDAASATADDKFPRDSPR